MPAENNPKVAQLAHILLKVSDITRSQRFYVDLLGFQVRPAKPLPDGRPFVPFHGGLALTSGGRESRRRSIISLSRFWTYPAPRRDCGAQAPGSTRICTRGSMASRSTWPIRTAIRSSFTKRVRGWRIRNYD